MRYDHAVLSREMLEVLNGILESKLQSKVVDCSKGRVERTHGQSADARRKMAAQELADGDAFER